MMRIVFVLGCLWLPYAAFADCNDDTGFTPNPSGDEDCDGDGWKKDEGDCNDQDENTHPEAIEDCDNPSDENCDGFFDEGCERAIQRGSLSGGSSCGSTGGAAGLLFLLPLLRRRRS